MCLKGLSYFSERTNFASDKWSRKVNGVCRARKHTKDVLASFDAKQGELGLGSCLATGLAYAKKPEQCGTLDL